VLLVTVRETNCTSGGGKIVFFYFFGTTSIVRNGSNWERAQNGSSHVHDVQANTEIRSKTPDYSCNVRHPSTSRYLDFFAAGDIGGTAHTIVGRLFDAGARFYHPASPRPSSTTKCQKQPPRAIQANRRGGMDLESA
jgi:hypothetical protein